MGHAAIPEAEAKALQPRWQLLWTLPSNAAASKENVQPYTDLPAVSQPNWFLRSDSYAPEVERLHTE